VVYVTVICKIAASCIFKSLINIIANQNPVYSGYLSCGNINTGLYLPTTSVV
jgi:hypothetical protein